MQLVHLLEFASPVPSVVSFLLYALTVLMITIMKQASSWVHAQNVVNVGLRVAVAMNVKILCMRQT
jgi:hypothetical protein